MMSGMSKYIVISLPGTRCGGPSVQDQQITRPYHAGMLWFNTLVTEILQQAALFFKSGTQFCCYGKAKFSFQLEAGHLQNVSRDFKGVQSIQNGKWIFHQSYSEKNVLTTLSLLRISGRLSLNFTTDKLAQFSPCFRNTDQSCMHHCPGQHGSKTLPKTHADRDALTCLIKATFSLD